jgi:hypothetical protein
MGASDGSRAEPVGFVTVQALFGFGCDRSALDGSVRVAIEGGKRTGKLAEHVRRQAASGTRPKSDTTRTSGRYFGGRSILHVRLPMGAVRLLVRGMRVHGIAGDTWYSRGLAGPLRFAPGV